MFIKTNPPPPPLLPSSWVWLGHEVLGGVRQQGEQSREAEALV